MTNPLHSRSEQEQRFEAILRDREYSKYEYKNPEIKQCVVCGNNASYFPNKDGKCYECVNKPNK